MQHSLTTAAEKRAVAAEDLPAFQGFKLLHAKNTLGQLLTLIGREELFAEYTKHDMSHIEAMLRLVDWLIPAGTAEEMTPADWLMLVLSIYLHDLGMVVTRDEYDSRPRLELDSFRDERLFSGDDGADYKARLEGLPEDQQERFIYQEFIRATHGQRVRRWLAASPESGASGQMHAEVTALSATLPKIFRADLGAICESHHLDDLADTTKYPLNKPYGNSEAETVNLQYSAVILRSADLLHITSDRTPPVLFRTINPTDPISQGEWIKQLAVRSVRPQSKVHDDGSLDENAQPDTVEVFAHFTDPDGFFGLTSYLTYAEQQLKRSYQWISGSAAKIARTYTFPWRAIDTNNVEVEGYLPQPFEFTIDQHRVLSLLTGHTLYNRTDVVVRELVQNSLDAVRLQAQEEDSAWEGRVHVDFDSEKRVLHVTDNGTGMTQSMIERHLLRVGSSRYQDPEFRKEHPFFSAISRFGIGVLSTFMVADRVEVTTVHMDDEQARELSLRSVHGKYLIKLLDKGADSGADLLGPHGTRISLWLRPSAVLNEVAEIMHRWIVIPRCSVSVAVDGAEAEAVGFVSAKSALEAWLTRRNLEVSPGSLEIRVDERDGVEVAWAVRWSKYFRDWSLINVERGRGDGSAAHGLGLCVEGVRVEDGTPGFGGGACAAIANAVGLESPKTNVARSGLEDTPERAEAFRSLYGTLCGHVSEEIKAMVAERDVSLTWATQEARYLLGPLRSGIPTSPQLFEEAVREVPILLVEENGARRAISPGELDDLPYCWTIESNTFASAERMLRELGASVSLASLKDAFKSHDLDLPDGPVVSGYLPESLETQLAFGDREVTKFIIRHDQRRVDLRWQHKVDGQKHWRKLREFARPQRREMFASYTSRQEKAVILGQGNVSIDGGEGETAIEAFSALFVLPNNELATFANRVIDVVEADDTPPEGEITVLFLESVLRDIAPVVALDAARAARILERQASLEYSELGRLSLPNALQRYCDLDELARVLGEVRWKVFDPQRWMRDGASG